MNLAGLCLCLLCPIKNANPAFHSVLWKGAHAVSYSEFTHTCHALFWRLFFLARILIKALVLWCSWIIPPLLFMRMKMQSSGPAPRHFSLEHVWMVPESDMWPSSAIKNIPAVRQAWWGIPLIPTLWRLSLMLSFWLLQPGLIANFAFHTHYIWTLVVEIMAVLFPFVFFFLFFLKCVCFHLYMEVGGQPWVSSLPRHHSLFYVCLLIYFVRLNWWVREPPVSSRILGL